MLTEQEISRAWRSLFRGADCTDELLAKAEQLLEELRPESPLRHRLSTELDELRQRMPELRKREKALHAELQGLEAAAVDKRTFLRLAGTMESFLERLRGTGETLDCQ